jgi:hypothetical protein
MIPFVRNIGNSGLRNCKSRHRRKCTTLSKFSKKMKLVEEVVDISGVD